MRYPAPRLAILISSVLFVSCSMAFAQDIPSSGSPPPKAQTEKQRKKQIRKAKDELGDSLAHIIEEDMIYILTKEERDAFYRLGTNEEREQYIEILWQRRNPNPDSATNEFKEEHYRRIAYANEHFSSGIPGWKTDRGHVYIVWGPPEEIESHPTGGTYDRPMWQGGGSTPTYNWELWRYRHMESVGDNIELEFVDPSGSGEYHLTTDPGEKDACAHVSSCGESISEILSGRGKADRFSNTNGTTLPAPLGGIPANEGEFERSERYVRVLGPPPVHFKDVVTEVSSRVLRNQMDVSYDVAFLRATTDSIIVPVTLQIPNGQMSYRTKDGVHSSIVNVYTRVTTPGGRVVQTSEEAVAHDVPDSLFQKSLAQSSLYQKSVPLHPGLYRLDIVVKDVESGNVAVINTSLSVPRYEEGVLNASTLILADKIESVPTGEIGSGQFVVGSYKVRPRLSRSFTNAENLGIFLQLYNLKTDSVFRETSVSTTYRLLRDKQQIWSSVERSGSIPREGEQVTLNRRLPLAAFAPGKYTLEIKVTDQISKQTVTRTADFEIAPTQSTRQ
ncbi:MAG: GWxTD domain-containing protein [Acidobacteria bacterium]|nr:GWxTD domain-containing protein [Acidobacteriota bacterium]MBS1864735.1 GWxTD domain-containing protein [Acidobacteriota bacterium]